MSQEWTAVVGVTELEERVGKGDYGGNDQRPLPRGF